MASHAQRPARVLLGLLVAAGLAGLAARAWHLYFVCDDAYISFRYARNLLEGHGLVFNPGEWVEGYTNFLWVLEVAALWGGLGVDPATASVVLSSLCTVGTLAVTAAWAARSTAPGRGLVVAAVAVLVLCTQRDFAVWTTSGLETRQFTLLVTLGLFALSRPERRVLWLGSLALGLAVLTRPEALLVWGVASVARLARRDVRFADAVAAGLPFALLLGGHTLLRLWLYGEVVPNTYVAKHVGLWVDMGLRYLGLASVHTGLLFVAPLAVVGISLQTRRARALAPLGGLAAVVAHGVFLVRMGGDHFEFRPLDWWWPVLAVGFGEGLVAGALWASRAVQLRWVAPAVGVAGGGVLLAYAAAPGVAHDLEVARILAKGHVLPRTILLHKSEQAWLGWMPPLPALLPTVDREGRRAVAQYVATRHHAHVSFARIQWRANGPYLEARDELDLPADAVSARPAIGIGGFALPDLVIIDEHGLTDAVIARNPLGRGRPRSMAHDRWPPKGYLERRGLNLRVYGAAETAETALGGAPWAVGVRPGLYLPFSTPKPAWARSAFAGRPLYRRMLSVEPAANLLELDGRVLRGAFVVGAFDDGPDGWSADVPRWRNASVLAYPVRQVGSGLAHTLGPPPAGARTATLTSPEFIVPPAAVLGFMIQGMPVDDAHVALDIDGVEVQRWSGTGSAELHFTWFDLAPWAASRARVRIVDRSTDAFVLADHFVVFTERDE